MSKESRMPTIDLVLACAACTALLVFDGYMLRKVRAEVRASTRR